MSTPNSGLSIAQQMLQDGSLPDKPDTGVPMRAVYAAVSTMNPDKEAQTQQLAQQAGMGVDLARNNPEAAAQRARLADLDRRELEIRNPILAQRLRDPGFAAVAHDDLDSLSRIEQHAASERANGFWARARSEAGSFAGNINEAVFGAVKPFVDAAGVAIQSTGETLPVLTDLVTGGDSDVDFDTLKDIWVRPRKHWVQEHVTGPVQDWLTQGILAGPPEYQKDQAGKVARNPDYHWYGRPLVNTIEQVPGALAAFALMGKLAGVGAETSGLEAPQVGIAGGVNAVERVKSQTVPAILGTQAAQTTYAQARSKGVDQKTAILTALYSGMTNYALMGRMPGAAPTETVAGAIGQWAGRSAALGAGMTLADNAIARGYDPDRSLTEGLPQSIATMAASEGVGTLGHIADAVEASRLRKRAPQVFQDFLRAHFEGDASLRVSAQDFVNYFAGKDIDPAVMANRVGVANLTEAAAAGSDLEIPKANFFGKLDPEHQKGLLPDIVDPATEMTSRQAEAGRKELEEWVTSGGPEKLQAEYAQADAETQATPEWKQVYGELKQRYVDAGETDAAADSYATLQANAISNLARKAGLKADELLALHNPNVTAGEAPGLEAAGEPRYQAAIEGIRSVVEAAKQPGDVKQRAVIAPVSDWVRQVALENGHDLEGFSHVVDASTVRHIKAEHGDEEAEKLRGQIAVSDEDFEQIPAIVSEPDRVVFGLKTRRGLDAIGYAKRLPDGSIAYLEEARTGKKHLAAVTMYKFPAGMDVDRIADNLHQNARSGGGNKPIVVRNPNAGKNEPLYQGDWRKERNLEAARVQGELLRGAGQESRDGIEGATGSQTALHTPTSRIPAVYRLIEADNLIPSHNAQTFERNAAYPEGVQERAYDASKEAQARVIQQAQGYEPAYTVNTNPDAVNGPPVITPEGVVLGGNSRTMATQRLYAEGGDVYRDYLKRNAAAFGFTPEQVDAMQKPVLVRQIAAPEGTQGLRRLGSELNKSMTGALGVAERAVSAGKNIAPETLRWVADTLNADDSTLRELMSSHGNELVRRMVQDGVITERERPQFVDVSTGGLSEEGKTFVERALLGTVIHDPRLMNAAPKSVLQKLERSLGAITSFASREDDWNIAAAVRAAVGELGSIQREGSTVELRLGQTSLFGGERNPVVDALVRKLDGKPTEVKAAFDDFARDADQNLPGQVRMFGGGEAFDAFNHAFGSKLSQKEFHDGLDELGSAGTGTEREDAQGAAPSPDDEGLPERAAGAGGEPSSDRESGVGVLPEPAETVHPGAAGAGDRGVLESPRGWFRVLPDGRYEIGKTKLGDFSTFIHEPAHAYLELFRELTQREGASDELKDDFRKICEWLGTTPEEAYKNGFTREQHEQWARGNELHVREGKAPTSGLKRAFHNFAVWLGSIYRRADTLGVELSDDIRGVMDRLYAGDTAVERAEQEAGHRPLFESPEEAGWTEDEFRKYARGMGVEEMEARKLILAEMHDAAQRERTEAWREEKSNVRDAVTAQVDARPEYRAIRALREGRLKDETGNEIALTLNRDALVKQFGEERVKALRDLHRGLYRNEGGTDAETAAEMLGFGSGEEMMRALEKAPRRAAAIEQAVRDTMTARHGDIRYDGSLDDKARLAVENDERSKNLHRELSALRKRVATLEQKAADAKAAMRAIIIEPLEHYQAAARQMIEQKPIADLQPNRYLTASRKFSREAFDALRKGDVKRAADAKNKELLNHFLFREASAARDYAEKFESYAKRMQSRGIQQRLGLAGSDFREQFNWLMARYRLGPAPQAPERTLREWADEVYGQGNEPAIAPGILDESRFADYRNVPLSEVRDLHDALINIRHLAMQQFKMFVQGKQVEFREAKQSMIEAARTNLKSNPEQIFEENLTRTEKFLRGLQWVDSRLIRMERLVEWLDGGKTGPWHDNLWNLASDAQGDEYKLQEDVTRVVTDALASMPIEMRRRLWTEKVNVEGIPEPLPRRRLLSMAFNMGNEGNLDRLRKTFISFGWDPEAIRRIGGMLTREEWQFVQKAWESLKPLGVRMQELEKRLTGLPPAMVKVTPFKVALEDGTEMDLDGGYFPIAMDPRFSQRAIEQDSRESAQNAMQSGYVRATTSKGYTKERTGFGGPLLLDYEQVLTSHVAKVAKDLSHREFMLASQRLLLDTEVRKTLRETLGPAYEQQFMPWLRTIINDNNGSVQERTDTFKDKLQTLRSNIVSASLGFNTSTSLLQISHAPRMLLYAKTSSLAQAFVDLLAHPIETSREVREMSPSEMRFRGDNLDRDIRAVLQQPDYKSGYSRKVAVAARFALEVMDHLLSHTLWKAAYRDALDRHVELSPEEAHEKAVHEADSAVRLGLGTSAPKDLPAIMRSNEFNKFITTLYGFHNGVYNQLRDIGHQFRYDRNVGKATVAGILTVVVPAVLGNWLTGRGPKDDENSGWWAAKKSLIFAADTVPILRSIASAMEGGHDVQFSPIENVAQKGAKALMDATTGKDDKDWLGIALNAAESAGEVGGVPGSHQVVKTLRYIKRAHEGKVENPNVWNAIVGGGR
jgi:hypothetical protein